MTNDYMTLAEIDVETAWLWTSGPRCVQQRFMQNVCIWRWEELVPRPVSMVRSAWRAGQTTADEAVGQILVSRTVRDLVVGSGVALQDRGAHQLKGVEGTWQLFAVTRP
jgi:hypothetical protein